MPEEKIAASPEPSPDDPEDHAASAMKTKQTQAAEAELIACYRPIGIAAVAAALALPCARPVTAS